jgi:hypothetical protein
VEDSEGGCCLQCDGRREASSSMIIWICSGKSEKGGLEEGTILCFSRRTSTVSRC